MTLAPAGRLDDVALRDPSCAPLARLQAIALRALETEAAWRDAARSMPLERIPPDQPVLHGAEARIDPRAARELFAQMAEAAGLRPDGIDASALIAASASQDAEGLERIADELELDPRRLMAVAHLLTWPLLLAAGERASEMPERAGWPRGHCPVCGAWPLLAELRGLDRARVLRCGRCAAAWPSRHLLCVFCGTDDHRKLTYLAAEDQRETRRAQVCASCRGYLKSVATLRSLDAAGLAIADLDTLHLDIAAESSGYTRPADPAMRLDLRIVAG